MTANVNLNSTKKLAKVSGALYLLVIIFGMFAELYVNLRLIVPGDAAATAGNIKASEMLFRAGFMSGLFHHTCFLLLVLVLYRLLKPIHKTLATLMALLGFVPVPIMMLNMLNQFAALLLLSGEEYLTVFTTDQLQALAILFLNLHSHGYFIAGMFSGSFLLPLGYLVYKSGYFPKFLGILLIIGGFGYLAELSIVFIFPSYEIISFVGLAAAVIAEFSFTFWLLLKGVRIQQA